MFIFFIINIVIGESDVRWKQQNAFYLQQGLDVGAYTETGYVKLNEQDKYVGQYFYHLFLKDGVQSLDAIGRNDKFAIWLNGGPGSASQLGNFLEIGPIKITEQEGVFTLTKRAQAWNKVTHLVFVDQPFNVGLSYAENEDLVKDTPTAAKYFTQFLTKFLEEKQQFKNCEFYLFGESYAGHYIPVFGEQIHKEGTHKNFKGVAIGDGLTSPFDQVNFYHSYLFNIGIVDEFRRKKVEDNSRNFQNSFIKGDLVAAGKYLEEGYGDELSALTGGMSPYNFQQYSGNDNAFVKFLNKNLKEYDVPAGVTQYRPSNDHIFEIFGTDIPSSTTKSLEYLLDQNINVLIFNGQLDYLVNTPGGMQWVNNLNWKYIYQWKSTNKLIFKALNKGVLETAGSAKVYKNLCLATVYRAGHLVPTDNPEGAFAMIDEFLNKWIA